MIEKCIQNFGQKILREETYAQMGQYIKIDHKEIGCGLD
jgi:hypothetical protein